MKTTFKTKIAIAMIFVATLIFVMVPIYIVGTYLDNVHHTHTIHYVLEGVNETIDCWQANCNYADTQVYTNNPY